MDRHSGNLVLLRGAALWLLVALILAWCLVGWAIGVPIIKSTFEDYERLLQAHISFLLIAALIFGIYAAKVPLPWHVRWSIVIGAFTNSSLFLFMSAFPILEFQMGGWLERIFQGFMFSSMIVTTYGFGMGAVIIFRSTFREIKST
jgi:hypothetical protein